MTKMGLKLALVVFSLGLINYAKADSLHSLIIAPAILGADPAPKGATGRPVATGQRTKKTVNGDEFKLVSEKQLKEAGIKDAKKFGEAWEDPTGMIWGDIAKKEDGSPRFMNFKDAETYCKELGAELPSGYDEERNGKAGFPDRDSDFVRLRKYRRVKRDDGYEPLDPKAKQVLPNLTSVNMKGETFNLWFWSSSVNRAGSSHDCYSFDGKGVDVSQYTLCLEDQSLAVRCVVHAPAKANP